MEKTRGMKRAILAIIFRKNKNKYEYLVLKRIPSRGGFWQPVSGRVEKNETPLEAAKREVVEETGIEKFKRVVENFYNFSLENESDKKSFCFGFEVEKDTQIKLDGNIYPEHDEIKWCGLNEAIRLLKWPHNKEALRKLNKHLNTNIN